MANGVPINPEPVVVGSSPTVSASWCSSIGRAPVLITPRQKYDKGGSYTIIGDIPPVTKLDKEGSYKHTLNVNTFRLYNRS